MGPYCRFCQRRCFVFLPDDTPCHIRRAYGSAELIATCHGGQEYEQAHIGFSYRDILAYRERIPCTPREPTQD